VAGAAARGKAGGEGEMSRADGKRQLVAQRQKAERERLRAEKKQAKRDKRTGAAAVPPEPRTVLRS
jgi:hypothetical protein